MAGNAAQWAALVLGAVFLVIGGLGSIPGSTAHYDELTVAGHHSQAALLGVSNVSVLHNAVHLHLGLAVGMIALGLLLGRRRPGASAATTGGSSPGASPGMIN